MLHVSHVQCKNEIDSWIVRKITDTNAMCIHSATAHCHAPYTLTVCHMHCVNQNALYNMCPLKNMPLCVSAARAYVTTMQLFDLINDSPIDATLIGNAAQADTIANMPTIE